MVSKDNSMSIDIILHISFKLLYSDASSIAKYLSGETGFFRRCNNEPSALVERIMGRGKIDAGLLAMKKGPYWPLYNNLIW